MEDDLQYWPFPIPAPEEQWSEFDRDVVNFMRTAFAEGFQPRMKSALTLILAESTNHREIAMILRGRRSGYEILPYDREQEIRLGPYYQLDNCACVCARPPFRDAAWFALEWLRGRELSSLLLDFEFVGGRPAGIVRRQTDAGGLAAVCEA
jgi:hypothetical protein